MKFDVKEYEEMILQLNRNKNKKIISLVSLIFAIIVFIVTLISVDIFSAIIVSIFIGIAIYYVMKKSFDDLAKKANVLNGISGIDQTLYEDKIVEILIKEDNEEIKNVYYYKDIVFIKQDKLNFYLYLNKQSAIIVKKDKLANIDEFETILKNNNLLK